MENNKKYVVAVLLFLVGLSILLYLTVRIKRNRRHKKKKKSGLFGLILIFLIGVGILCYPAFSNLWNQRRNELMIVEYTDTITRQIEEEARKIMENARLYNEQHTANIISSDYTDEENKEFYSLYESLLNPNKDGVMGYLEIPEIDVKLAIYHGVGAVELEKGCGHMVETSLPIRGDNVHAVLAAHRGLPRAKLFTDLDRLEVGDLFYITVLDDRMEYKVDQIKTVLPNATEELDIVEGENHVTLLTCTPYGVNSHRLLVRGKQTDYVEEKEKAEEVTEEAPDSDFYGKILFAGIISFVIIAILIIWIEKRKRIHEKE